MSPVFRRGRRSKIRQTNSGIEISIPSKLHLFVLFFLLVWLMIGGVTVYFSLQTLLADSELGQVFWFIFWALMGGGALYICLWMLIGKEIVSLRSGVLTIKHVLLGYGRTRQYKFLDVSNLRVDPEPYDSEGPRLSALYPFRTGPIAFEYGGRTVRFADGVGDAEAHEIVVALSRAPGTTKRISP